MAAPTRDDSSADGGQAGAWALLLDLCLRAKTGQAARGGSAFALDDQGSARVVVDLEAPRSWRWSQAGHKCGVTLQSMLDLYMPLCVGGRANQLVVAHLGQSLDGRIATSSGASQFITGEDDLIHTHRMRALFDAVVVGAGTAAADNPSLTTRRVDGEHATRVVLDPRCSVAPEASIFTDGLAETLVLCDQNYLPTGSALHLGLPTTDGKFSAADILRALREHGLQRVFIEGGGVTVSEFLRAGCLDRLQVCVAPMIIGSGRPAFQLPEIEHLEDSVFLEATHFVSGKDILFDCQLRDAGLTTTE